MKKKKVGRKPLPKRQLVKNQRAQHTQWSKENTRAFAVRLHKKYDAEVIAKLDSQDNKAQYIKQLIEKDIKEGNS